MARATGRLFVTAATLSVVAHGLLLTALWVHSPRLFRPHEQAGPPEPIIPVLIMPRTPPAAVGAGQKPQPIRLHRRQLRREVEGPPLPPLVAEAEPEALPPPAAPRAPVAPRVTVQPTPARQLSDLLRASPVGCANLALLDREERAACEGRLGRGTRAAPYLAPAFDPAKGGALEAAGAARDRAIRAREAPLPTGAAAPEAAAGASNRNKPLYIPILPPLRP
jgi:hypothetical protein